MKVVNHVKLTVYQKKTISTNICQMDTNMLAPIMGDTDEKKGGIVE